ncbi:PREDICTED: myb-like protein X [Camelina sativa]|uniref:Myb-like protein X n=1 Tax=Camelina sativa TaxID=90675 RepID=A0ABM0TWK4_CAMSA|nr:PREDICTED: myb-like protein X [Camelina sativa]XP_010432519.1 PREDICTED: myb-like protein X [Camelina sativa]XP_010432520.1 PREDICTED: myb-like protein X [Camelina sativa]
MKKASSRSQRGSKGIKGKHVLQICVLLGVCIWLIYQVKYSHDKKEFYEKDGEKSTVLLSEVEDGVVKLGRKDLLPGYHIKKEKREKEDEDEDEISHGGEEKKSKVEDEKEEEEEVVEEDEEDKNKQGEEVAEEDEEENKHEEDEIDEQDQSKTVGDTDKDDETLEEEKESGTSESDEKEKDTTHADEIDMTVDEAREEHYKADDASSAVSHESRILNTEKLKESSNETAQENNSNSTTSEVEIQKQPVLKLGEAADVVNKTTTEVKDSDSEPSSSEAKSAVTELQGETVNSNSTEAILEATGFLQNEAKIMRDRSQEKSAPPAGFSEPQPVLELEQISNEFDPNITVSANITNKDSLQDESRNSTSESLLIENISGSNMTEVKENSRFEGDDESAEKESSNVFSTELTEEADNTSETSISQEEMDALTDPQTLPDIRIEGNEEDEEEAIGTE